MKNYLGNLIARHLNQVEVLQPRLASRFEPHSSALKTEVLEPDSSNRNVDAADPSGADSGDAVSEPLIAAPEIERRIESPPVQPPRSAVTRSDSSGLPRPTYNETAQPESFQPDANVLPRHTEEKPNDPAALPTSAVVAVEQRDQPTVSALGYVQPVSSVDLGSSETPGGEAPAAPVSSAPLITKPRLPKSVDQLAEAEDAEQRMLAESSPAPITAKPFPRAARTKTRQTLTPASPVDLQPQVLQTKTKTNKQTVVPAAESSTAISSVPGSEARGGPDQPGPGHSDFPVELDGPSADKLPVVVNVLPEVEKSPAVNSVEGENQASPRRRERIPEQVREPQQTQRAPALETSVVRSLPNNSMSDRKVAADEMMPMETGPTINVTIGRIEVRAATQSSEARPQQQRREQQVLSLDEYLSQRSAGGR